MRVVHRIDSNGIFLENVILQDEETTPIDCVDVPMTNGIFLPAKFENGQWISTLSQNEIDDKLKFTVPVNEVDTLKKQQELMQKAIDDLILGGVL